MSDNTTVLAIMQNQWFKDPGKVEELYRKRPNQRRDLIRRFLFAGCKSGRVLRQVFGDWCDRIVWEESSPRIGGHASSKYDADLDYLTNVIVDVNPRVIIGFGVIACRGLEDLNQAYIRAPHPAARQPTVIAELTAVRERMETLLSKSPTSRATHRG